MFVFAEYAAVLDLMCMGDGIQILVFCGNAMWCSHNDQKYLYRLATCTLYI